MILSDGLLQRLVVYKSYRLQDCRSYGKVSGDGNGQEKNKEGLCQVQPHPVSYCANKISLCCCCPLILPIRRKDAP